MIRYRTQWARIEAMEVIRETGRFVIVRGWSINGPSTVEHKESKRSEYTNWHNTWDDAHKFILEQQVFRVADFEKRLADAKTALASIEAMTRPQNSGGQS